MWHEKEDYTQTQIETMLHRKAKKERLKHRWLMRERWNRLTWRQRETLYLGSVVGAFNYYIAFVLSRDREKKFELNNLLPLDSLSSWALTRVAVSLAHFWMKHFYVLILNETAYSFNYIEPKTRSPRVKRGTICIVIPWHVYGGVKLLFRKSLLNH